MRNRRSSAVSRPRGAGCRRVRILPREMRPDYLSANPRPTEKRIRSVTSVRGTLPEYHYNSNTYPGYCAEKCNRRSKVSKGLPVRNSGDLGLDDFDLNVIPRFDIRSK